MPPLNLLPHSCIYCRKIAIELAWSDRSDTLYPLRNKLASLSLSERLFPLHEGTYPFEFTFAEARHAANHGCGFAMHLLSTSDVLNYASSPFRPHGFLRHPMDSWELIGIFNPPSYGFKTSSRFSCENIARVLPDISSIRFAFASLKPNRSSVSSEHQIMYKHTGATFDVFAYHGDFAARYISARPVEAEPASEGALAKAASWLRTCQTQHARCHMARADGSRWTPKRLLDSFCYSKYSLPSMIRLVEPAIDHPTTQLFPYAALSYTWGGEQPLRLEKKIELAFKQGIYLDRLPQTFKDAAFVCIRLGIRYLWIDALCIIQDDNGNKAKEISTMPKVYGNAVVTISATRSPSVKDGFLGRRSLEHKVQEDSAALAAPGLAPEALQETYQIPFYISHFCSASTPVGSIVLCEPDHELEPLMTRGWTFQEQILATRTIEFGSLRTTWHCLESHGLSGLVDGWKDNSKEPENGSSWHDEHRRFWQISPDLDPLIDTNEAKVRALQIWKGMVEGYSSRNLTNSTDRILAISGVADRLGPLLGTYRAGLWEPSLVAELLWVIDYTEEYERQGLLPRPCKYQGPSWSWVSVNSRITYMEFSPPVDETKDDIAYFSFEEHKLTPFSAPLVNRQMRLHRFADISKCQTEPTYPDAPFGSIREASALLEIDCAVTIASMRRRKGLDQGPDLLRDMILNQAIVKDKEVLIFPDALDDTISDDATTSVQLIEVASCWDYSERALDTMTMYDGTMQSLGLVVVPLEDGTERFRRVGLFRHRGVTKSSYSWQADYKTVDYSSERSFQERSQACMEQYSVFSSSKVRTRIV